MLRALGGIPSPGGPALFLQDERIDKNDKRRSKERSKGPDRGIP